MMAIEYTDMISKMITTVIATGPMCLTISVKLISWPPCSLADGVAACQRRKRKPKAFVPRVLIRIVTVDPPRFDYIDFLQAINQCAGSSYSSVHPARLIAVCSNNHCMFNVL